LARRRRLASDTDERYLTGLTGLSRISVPDEVRELTCRSDAARARFRRQPERELPFRTPRAVAPRSKSLELGNRKLAW